MAASTILVVDGDLASRNYIATALQKEGHSVLQAGSGKEGLIYAWRDRPDLIIVEPALADLAGEELAARLRSDARTSKVPLVALSRDTSPARKTSCIDAGFNDFVVKGPEAIPALFSAIQMLLVGAPVSVRTGGLLISFLSAKGGTGTSCLCANTAMCIADRIPESSVAVADLVLPMGSIAGLVGYREPLDLPSLAAMSAEDTGPEFLKSRLVRLDDWGFHLLAGSPDPQHGIELVVGRIGELVANLKAAYDFVLLDIGRSLSRICLPLIEESDLIALVISADVSTVALTETVWQYLQSKGVKPDCMFPILNRAIGLEGLTKPEIEKSLGIPVRTAVPYLGGSFAMANNLHQPYSLKYPNDTASIVLKDCAQQMIDQARRLRAA